VRDIETAAKGSEFPRDVTFGAQGLRWRFLRSRVQGSGYKIEGLGFRVQGSGFKV
jgi:hypothetical protein